MSKRRHVGDIVLKKANAGFVGQSLVVKLLDIDLEMGPTDYCFLKCGDPDCKEWTNAMVMDGERETGSYCCHISECEMEDCP